MTSSSTLRRGMTLIEIMAVVLILSLVVGLVTIRLDFMVPKYRLRAAAREVGFHAKRARAQAASTGKDVYIKYDLSRGTYWLLVAFPKKAAPGSPEENQPPKEFVYETILRGRLPDEVEFVSVILGSKEIYTQGEATIRVSPFGSAHHHILNLRLKSGQEIATKINGFTGAVTFYDRHLEPEELLEDTGP
jgi:prepilin-type N-terminal cleavage/methylation domain-containing protein